MARTSLISCTTRSLLGSRVEAVSSHQRLFYQLCCYATPTADTIHYCYDGQEYTLTVPLPNTNFLQFVSFLCDCQNV